MTITAFTDLATELECRVRSRLSGRIRDFRLDVQETGLVLRGWSPTYYGKQLAQQAIMQATEFPILDNKIEVAFSRQGPHRPAALRAEWPLS